ncbi:MAG: O-antigen ligase family protein [Candidatus Omnitrophica bacterium]|nr:O-antigen ligase family protein [Candidatus Omnitrophota bacterium]
MISEQRERIARYFDKIAAWALYILIFALPFSKSIIEIGIVVALVAVMARKALKRERLFALNAVNIALLAFVLASLPSFINTAYTALSLKALFTKILKFAALFLVAQEALNDRIKIKNFSVMALISCVVIVIDAFIQYFVTYVDILHGYPSFQFSTSFMVTYPGSIHPRITTFLGAPTASFPFPNDFASWILVMIFPVAIMAIAYKGKPLARIFFALLSACLMLFLILTKTRGAWLAFGVGLLIAPLFSIKFRSIKRPLALFAVIILLASPFVLKKHMKGAVTSFGGIAERNTMWSNGWKIFKQHPVIGSGINTFFVNYMNIREDEYKGKKGSYAHNCYLQIAADTGLLGLSAFLAFAAALVWRARHLISKTEDALLRCMQAGLALGMIAYLVHAFTDTNLFSLNLAALFWVSAGLLASMGRISEGA